MQSSSFNDKSHSEDSSILFHEEEKSLRTTDRIVRLNVRTVPDRPGRKMMDQAHDFNVLDAVQASLGLKKALE